MFTTKSTVLLWLFVINIGIAFGAGIFEHRILAPQWLVEEGGQMRWDAEAVRRDDTGLRFWAFVTSGSLTLLTLASLVVAWRSSRPERGWWLAAALLILGDRVMTFAYFIPTMIGLMEAPDSPAAVATASRWMNLNHLRHALVFGGWLAALKAFAVHYQGRR